MRRDPPWTIPYAARLIARLLAATLGLALTALTADPDFMIDAWQSEDGLPQSSVKAITQTPDGYLWLVTFGGLARFDGVRFTVFDTDNSPGLASNRLVFLDADPQGVLWLVTEHGEIVRFDHGVAYPLDRQNETNPAPYASVRIDRQGRPWVAQQSGALSRIENGTPKPILAAPGLGPGPVSAFFEDNEGDLWLTQGTCLARFDNNTFHPFNDPENNQPASVKLAFPSRRGGLWIVTPDGLARYRPVGREGPWIALPQFDSHLVAGLEDLEGNLWLATYADGLFQLDTAGRWHHLTSDAGFPSGAIWCLFLDREGSLWVGTNGNGLLRVKPRLWRTITRRDGLGVDAVHSVSQDSQGRIWFAGGTHNPYCLDHGVVTVAIPSPIADVMDGVFSVLPARDGTLWIGVYRGKVFHYRDGNLTPYGPAEGMRAGSVRALLEDRHGAIWVGGFEGLSRIADRRVQHFSRRDGLSADKVWALAEDAQGTLFIGTQGGGLNLWHDNHLTAFSRQDGLPDDKLIALHPDADGALWIGTYAGGLCRFQHQRFTPCRVPGGLPMHRVGPIIADNSDHLWMATEQGIARVHRQDLHDFADGKTPSLDYLLFDRHDGLLTPECSGIQPAALRANDGTLWFGTAKGAAFFDPRRLRDNPVPPPVLIEEVRVDDTPADTPATHPHIPPPLPNTPTAVLLPPRHFRVAFRFTGLSLAAPAKVRFRYRLEGFDPGWIDGGTTRSASYTRLPPGQYRFRVTACNNQGVWNDSGAAIDLTVLHPWWQTWRFRTLALAFTAALVLGTYEWRILQLKRRRFAQQRFSRRLIASQEDERQRLAAELHDGLGQHLLVIKNMAALGSRTTPPSLPQYQQFSTIDTLASQAIGEVRQIARALRPCELDRLGLTKALTWLVKPAGDSANIRFETDIDDLTGVLPPEFEINLYRVVQESLSNILKHAHATTARLEVRLEPLAVRVFIQDNGCGFAPPTANLAATSTGMGLTDMAERVRIMGGHLTVESAPGAGTRLHLLIPRTPASPPTPPDP